MGFGRGYLSGGMEGRGADEGHGLYRRPSASPKADSTATEVTVATAGGSRQEAAADVAPSDSPASHEGGRTS